MKRYKMIGRFIKPFKFSFANLLICVLVTSFISMVYPYLFGLLVDEVFYHQNIKIFIFIVFSYLIVFFLERIISFILSLTWTYLSTSFSFSIRSALFNNIFKMKASFLSSSSTGELMTVINSDTDKIIGFIHNNVFVLFAQVIQLLIAMFFVMYINYYMGILMIILVPILVHITRAFSKKIRAINEKNREEYGKFISWVFEVIDGLREIRLLAAQKSVMQRFSKILKKILRLNVESSYSNFRAGTANQLVLEFMNIAIYIVAVFFIMRNSLTVGGFVALFEYYYTVQVIYTQLSEKYRNAQNDFISIDRVGKLFEENTEGNLIRKDIKLNTGEIKIVNVDFEYEKDVKVLNTINLLIKDKETIALVGKSGEGKSTIVSLLLGFYSPQNGAIFIDDNNINEIPVNILRKTIGLVSQDTYIMEGTIKENLWLGTPTASDNEMWEALKLASIDKEIRELPNQLDTIIGFEGQSMSGGQLQRISIARIFLRNPKILIFDEATSTLDVTTEKAIQRAWVNLSKKRTTIIIAHRLQTFIHSDKIVVLANGRIVGFDKHDFLIENCKEYQELFQEVAVGGINI